VSQAVVDLPQNQFSVADRVGDAGLDQLRSAPHESQNIHSNRDAIFLLIALGHLSRLVFKWSVLLEAGPFRFE